MKKGRSEWIPGRRVVGGGSIEGSIVALPAAGGILSRRVDLRSEMFLMPGGLRGADAVFWYNLLPVLRTGLHNRRAT